MKKVLFIVFLMLAISPNTLGSDFESIYEKSLRGTLEISALDEVKAKQFVWVFVAGFLNEGVGFTSHYFGDNRDRLLDFLPSEQVEIIRPDSAATILVNAERLFFNFQEIYKKRGKKLIVITHSKGSPETLKMIANQPKKSAEMIQSVLTIQAAFGSRVADLFEDGDLSEQGGYIRLPWDKKATLKLAYYSKKLLSLWLADGFKTLTIESARDIFNSEVRKVLKNQAIPIYFLRTSIAPEDMALSVRSTGGYLSHFGENDGMVNIENQMLEGIGEDLGVIEADHTDTVLNGWPISNTNSQFRYSLTDAIFHFLISREKW